MFLEQVETELIGGYQESKASVLMFDHMNAL